MGLFFEVHLDFVALGRSRDIGSGLQSQSPGVFLLIPTLMKGLCAFNRAPAGFGLRHLTKIRSGFELESLRSNKKGDTQKQDFAIPIQEPRTFSVPSLVYFTKSFHKLKQHNRNFVLGWASCQSRMFLPRVQGLASIVRGVIKPA